MTTADKLTEEKIFEAATDVFLTKGMDGARMQDIADCAGINKSLLHYYFRSKEKLFMAVFEMIAKKMYSRFIPVINKEISLEEKIRFFYNEHITFLQKNPRLPIFILNEINRNPKLIKKIYISLNVEKLWEMLEEQHRVELGGQHFSIENLIQIMTSIASISLFPFAARGLIVNFLEKLNIRFDDYLETRKEFATEFVIGAIKSENLNKFLVNKPTLESVKKSIKHKNKGS